MAFKLVGFWCSFSKIIALQLVHTCIFLPASGATDNPSMGIHTSSIRGPVPVRNLLWVPSERFAIQNIGLVSRSTSPIVITVFRVFCPLVNGSWSKFVGSGAVKFPVPKFCKTSYRRQFEAREVWKHF